MGQGVAEKYGLSLYELPVGFKHVTALMLKKDILIGGEEAGGIGIKLHTRAGRIAVGFFCFWK